jgi:hypothetical protein
MVAFGVEACAYLLEHEGKVRASAWVAALATPPACPHAQKGRIESFTLSTTA